MSFLKPPFNFKKYIITYLVIILLILSFFSGIIVGQKKNYYAPLSVENDIQLVNKDEIPESLARQVDFNLFWQVWDLVKKKYIDQPVREADLFYGALAGIVASLGDPYSVFLDPEMAQKFNQELSGTFEGIGAEIGIKNNILTIIAPLPASPAEKAGLKSKDQVWAIDGLDTSGISLDLAVSLIRGPRGTEVVLAIRRDSWERPEEITVIREEINVESVSSRMLPGRIAYIEILYFNEDTESTLSKVIRDILVKNPQGIILDLRNNPGGYLEAAVEVASEWIEDGVVVIEEFSGRARNEHKAKGRARLKNIKTVVLINEGSASGSEIVAGALQDHNQATLVGVPTFGKGSVQELETLKDGSSVKLTVARWLTPLGKVIEELGIIPDFEVELTEEDYNADRDPQLDKAIEILSTNN